MTRAKELEKYLKDVSTMSRKVRGDLKWPYSCFEEFVLKNGDLCTNPLFRDVILTSYKNKLYFAALGFNDNDDRVWLYGLDYLNGRNDICKEHPDWSSLTPLPEFLAEEVVLGTPLARLYEFLCGYKR
jgi:hypothetical protein